MTKKIRPLRVFYDNKQKSFYITSNGKKKLITLPKEINSLDKAQKYIDKKLVTHVDLPARIPTEVKFIKKDTANSHFSTELPLNDNELVNLYKEYIASKQPEKLNISPETIRKAKVAYDVAEMQKKERKDTEKALRLVQEQKDRTEQIARLATVSNNTQQSNQLLNELKEEEKKLKEEIKQSSANEAKQLEEQSRILGDIANDGKTGKQLLNDIKTNFESANALNSRLIEQQTQLLTYILDTQNEIEFADDEKGGVEIEDVSAIPTPAKDLEKEREAIFETRIGNTPFQLSDIKEFKKWNTSDRKLDYLYKVIEFLGDQKNYPWIDSHFEKDTIGMLLPKSTQPKIKIILAGLTPEDYNYYVDRKDFPPEFQKYPVVPVKSSKRGPYTMQIGDGSRLTPLWDSQISEFFEDEPRFGGVISSDEIDTLPNKIPMGFIMNLDKRKDEGSHWVAVYITPQSLEYFDPLAEPPSADFVKRMKKKIKDMNIPNMLKFKINEVAQQHGNSKHCGYHCIRFLDDRFNDLDFPLSTRYYNGKTNNSKHGEGVIKKEFELI